MIDIKKLEPGMVVFDVHRQKPVAKGRGAPLGTWQVKIVSVDLINGRVLASWNGNPAATFVARNGKFKWRKDRPKSKV